jgi:hypothetical protein
MVIVADEPGAMLRRRSKPTSQLVVVGRRAGGADVGEEHFGVLYSDVMDHVFLTVTVRTFTRWPDCWLTGQAEAQSV